MWERVKKFHPPAAELADGHYSRRKIGSPQFMPPGQTIVLWQPGAVFGWWRPHPASGIVALNKLDGWTCTIFRNTTNQKSSALLLEAEYLLTEYAENCGPSGLITYVWDKKIRSSNPGYCYKVAGWRRTGRSADSKKTLLQKPWGLAGYQENPQ